MAELWKEKGRFGKSEQRMADKVRTIIKKKWFKAEELDKSGEVKSMRMRILEQY